MKKFSTANMIIMLCAFVSATPGFLAAEEKSLLEEMQIIQQEGEEKTIRENDQVIEKHFYKKEVIKEVPEEKDKYEKHLFDELKGRLDKPKKIAEVWRVEGDLIELNRGSIHKVREYDVYAIYGKHGRYKGKMEVGAVADAVSIGRHLNKYHLVEEADTARYIGQRRFWGSGLLYGINVLKDSKYIRLRDANYKAYGLYWRFLFRKGLGIGFSMAEIKREVFEELRKTDEVCPEVWRPLGRQINYYATYRFLVPCDVRMYFFHPSWYSCYAGAGISYFEAKYNLSALNDSFDEKVIENKKMNTIAPVITVGTELALNSYFRFVIAGYLFNGPEITIHGYEEFAKPLMLSVALIGAW